MTKGRKQGSAPNVMSRTHILEQRDDSGTRARWASPVATDFHRIVIGEKHAISFHDKYYHGETIRWTTETR